MSHLLAGRRGPLLNQVRAFLLTLGVFARVNVFDTVQLINWFLYRLYTYRYI